LSDGGKKVQLFNAEDPKREKQTEAEAKDSAKARHSEKKTYIIIVAFVASLTFTGTHGCCHYFLSRL